MQTKSKGKRGGKQSPSRRARPFELKQRAVKLYLEEGYPAEMVAQEIGVGHSTLNNWAKQYREQGAEALRPRTGRRGRPQASAAAKKTAVALKRQNPTFGTKRISQLLRRMFFLRAGPETVRQTLHEQQLIKKPKTKPKKNPARPRFFERTKPNQLWQADIFTFRLGGRAAYLIGYVDDYSRYVTGLDLFRSQTAEHVLEVYRQAVAEYGVPKEMLTDNGRQYTNWRGKTRFEAELSKDRIQHIKSRPHHPMTLGKVERLWKTIWGEFLCRAQFDSFEEARERVRLWVKYYNYKRPHQGIGGLCPADRFFEIQSQLRKVLEQGVAENVLEQALRGKPQAPFYLVGRMGEQSVVIRAEKGKVRMLVDGQAPGESKELVYKVEGGHGNEDGTGGAEGRAEAIPAARREDQMRSGAGDLVGATPTGGDLPGAGHQLGGTERLAEPGAGGDTTGPDAAAGAGGATAGAQPAAGAAAGAEDDSARREGRPSSAAVEGGGSVGDVAGETEGIGHDEGLAARTGPAAGGDDPEGARRSDDGAGGGAGALDQPQDVLQVGAAGPGGDVGGPLRAELGPARFAARWGAGEPDAESGATGDGAEGAGAAAAAPESAEA
jgi:transposase InsO family protein